AYHSNSVPAPTPSIVSIGFLSELRFAYHPDRHGSGRACSRELHFGDARLHIRLRQSRHSRRTMGQTRRVKVRGAGPDAEPVKSASALALELPDAQPILPRLSGAASLRRELEALL